MKHTVKGVYVFGNGSRLALPFFILSSERLFGQIPDDFQYIVWYNAIVPK